MKQGRSLVATSSKGLLKTPNLKYFLQAESIGLISKWKQKEYDLIVGWGNKKSAEAGREFAKSHNIPYLNIEDGFLRSLAPAKFCKAPLSIVFDDLGIYYDASKPSRLERIIIDTLTLTSEQFKRARKLIKFMRDNRISKYNQSSFNTDFKYKDYILVIDQTYGDLSIPGSLSDDRDFKQMLTKAVQENPDKLILVKSHPEVIAGTKHGYLTKLAKHHNTKLIADDINPWVLIENSSKVYTVSSQLGFEALLADKKVRCFGLPFYAGWGLTQDEKKIERRCKRSLEVVFTSAYMKYSKYLNPFSLELCEIEDTLDLLKMWRDINDKNKEITAFSHISPWKKRSINDFFSSAGKVASFAKINNAKPGQTIAAWSSKVKEKDIQFLQAKSIKLVRIEDGFIRSIGLGANFIKPQSLVIDFHGIYYDHHQPSDLEIFLNSYEFSPDLITRANNLINTIKSSNITKYNLATKKKEQVIPSSGKRKLLVIGQVEDDASIKEGTLEINTNLQLLSTVRRENTDASVFYRPHPDVLSGKRRGYVKNAVDFADFIAEKNDIVYLIEEADEVHTMTSLAGFEALIRGKQVFCYGLPFYAGWGLTQDRFNPKRRMRSLTIQELVAATLILYPRYVDPVTGLWCRPEDIINRFGDNRMIDSSILIKLSIAFGKLKRMLFDHI